MTINTGRGGNESGDFKITTESPVIDVQLYVQSVQL